MKKFLVAACLFCILCLTFALYITKNTPSDHPVLAASDLGRLIPTRAFYASTRQQYGYHPSADGMLVVSYKTGLLGTYYVVQEVGKSNIIARLPAELTGIRWHPTKHLLRFVYQGHDWEADPNNPEQENWTRTSPVKLSGGWELNEYATAPEARVLFWGRADLRETGSMWRVSQDGLNAEKVAKGNAKTRFWVFGEGGQAVLRVDSLDAATDRVFKKVGENWVKLIDVDLNDTFQPVDKVGSDGQLLARSSRGRDKVALVRFDTATGQETVMLENPDADIGLTTNLTFDQGPDLIRMGFANQDRVALTDGGQVFLDILNEFPQPISLGFTAPSPSGRYVAQAISPQSKSWIYLLIDLREKSYVQLGEFHLRKYKDQFSQEKAITFTARDGLEVPAILTMPTGVEGPIPFVVEVHGGPARHINLGYRHDPQFLANRGYGVLSVNFRGSTGFGKTFQAKGFKQFGRAMQDDIADAAMWLVDEGLADTDALTVMGASYGGYAAALAMTRDPGLFDAAIVEFPMLDAEFQSKYHPGFWNNGINAWWRYFGQVDIQSDLEDMRKFSPTNRVDHLHGPILIMAGLKDQITAVQQVKDFAAKVELAGKDVSVHYFIDAGHGVRGWRDELTRGRLMEDILARHAGGRSGGREFLKWAPDFID